MNLIAERIASSRNMALFINANKSITLHVIKLHLFYTSDSVIHGNDLFDENIFSVVQELPYKFNYCGTQIFSFRPDIVVFVNGIYLGYSELKSNYTSQGASKNGRGKVIKDYFEAVRAYHDHIDCSYGLSEKEKLVLEPKYQKYADAPIHILYSSNQDEQSARGLNDGLSEAKVLENFALKKNGLMIVVAKLQTGFDEKKLHTLFLDKEITGISAIQTISRVNRTTKNKNDCKIVDFSYNNVNVQNIKDAFEHFSDVVVSNFDPFGDKKVLGVLLVDLQRSDTYDKFFKVFMDIYKDPIKRDNPESYLDFESSLRKHIDANPQPTADTKAKATQYFTILNCIEYVIQLEAKYSEPSFLFFWRKFNTLYNMITGTPKSKDPIEVYFDDQIGIVEVVAEDTQPKTKPPTKLAEGVPVNVGDVKFNILAIIAARNEQEAKIGALIEEFETKIVDFFRYVSESSDGARLIVKINSHVSESEIYDDFAKIYRQYRAFYRKTVGDYFFKETNDLVDKLCDDFEKMVLESAE